MTSPPVPYRGSACGPRWGTFVPKLPAFAPNSKLLPSPLLPSPPHSKFLDPATAGQLNQSLNVWSGSKSDPTQSLDPARCKPENPNHVSKFGTRLTNIILTMQTLNLNPNPHTKSCP